MKSLNEDILKGNISIGNKMRKYGRIFKIIFQ